MRQTMKFLQADNQRMAEFKYFFYRSFPSKHWDDNIVEILTKLEQTQIISIDHLEVLRSFLEDCEDAGLLLRMVEDFQFLNKILKSICPQKDHVWLASPPVKIAKFWPSEDFKIFLRQLDRQMNEFPNISISDVYSQATQRIKKVAAERQDHASSWEAMFIAEHLMRIYS
ncbi:uncharacterized protein LOC124446293 [Xenia sp. Carnegie-2017]|uniref:uncharacterized protein LOC124446293 n=1 Tax=Xenia sp. Carnegie-2017 TaxID=2897299 RepID=UPI001F04324D|nr:uncharacterized protein LOC124446293 [Xenia sp. Carnegie-2017]